jgi:hypothetical protein
MTLTSKSDKEQYNRDNLCGSENSKKGSQLNVDTDFYWHTQGRGSFAIDWHLYCDREYLRSMISSIYFCGAGIGTSIGGFALYFCFHMCRFCYTTETNLLGRNCKNKYSLLMKNDESKNYERITM